MHEMTKQGIGLGPFSKFNLLSRYGLPPSHDLVYMMTIKDTSEADEGFAVVVPSNLGKRVIGCAKGDHQVISTWQGFLLLFLQREKFVVYSAFPKFFASKKLALTLFLALRLMLFTHTMLTFNALASIHTCLGF